MNNEEKMNVIKECDDKLHLYAKYLNLINISGYLEPAKDGQFDDVEDSDDDDDDIKNRKRLRMRIKLI